MSVDEYETGKLIDLGYEAGRMLEQMNIAHTTVQGIYDAARKKLPIHLLTEKRLLSKAANKVRVTGVMDNVENGLR